MSTLLKVAWDESSYVSPMIATVVSLDRHGFSAFRSGTRRTKFIGRRCLRRIKHAIRTDRCVREPATRGSSPTRALAVFEYLSIGGSRLRSSPIENNSEKNLSPVRTDDCSPIRGGPSIIREISDRRASLFLPFLLGREREREREKNIDIK